MIEYLKILFGSPRYVIVFLLGFSSGLPLALTASALEARYAASGVSLETIGLVTLIGLPYVFKFLWAPLLDKITFPLLSRRRGWMLATQCALILGLSAMAFFKAESSPVLLAGIGLIVALFSATQDVAIDAYRTEILQPEERGVGMAYFVAAYRVAMIVSTSVGFIIADYMGWEVMYLAMAACMGVGLIATFFGPTESSVAPPRTFTDAFTKPLQEFFSRNGAVLLLLFIVLYKFGDAFAAKMMTTFFVRGLSFSFTEIGTVYKLGGFLSMMFGAFVGGIVLTKTSLFRALMVFGVCQAVSNLMFVLLAYTGKHMGLFAATVCIEQFCGGMGTSAFLALVMALCDKRFTATQFACLTALSAVPREILGPASAYLVTHYGWATFYEITFFFSFPGLIILWLVRKQIPESSEEDPNGDVVAAS